MGDTGDKRIQRNDVKNVFNLNVAVEDIVFDIFDRLPIRDLARCKIVCKKWLKWIRNPEFINRYLTYSKEYPMYIVSPCLTNAMIISLVNEDGVPWDENEYDITFPELDRPSFPDIICSYNGLICFSNIANMSVSLKIMTLDVYISNPATQDIFVLPKCTRSKEMSSFGVAFGPRCFEYKMFRFFKPVSKIKKFHECEIYSSTTGKWRNIGIISQCPGGPMGSKHTFVNGKVYWFTSSDGDSSIPGSILSVNLEENFQILSLPNIANEHSFLVDLEGCLSMIISYPEKRHLIDIWVLKTYYNAYSWVKKCSTNVPIPEHDFVDSIATRHREVFFTTTEHFALLNLDDMKWKLDIDDIFGRRSTVTFSYTPCILPCKGVQQS